MAPILNLLRKDNRFSSIVCVTGQHREMLDQVLRLFEIKPNYDLDIMKPGQTLTEIAARIIIELTPLVETEQPDVILVHGDTTTALASSLVAFYSDIPIFHVEAGLRSGNLKSPWPEEGNRKSISALAQIHFAPTENAKKNLLSEAVECKNIYVTGNTVIDALFLIKERIDSDVSLRNQLKNQFKFLDQNKKLILVTGHRRESFGGGFERICKALTKIATKHPNCEILYPVHMNPRVRATVNEYLLGVDNIHLTEPLEYLPFVYIMDRSYIIITDSGGIQEEAPSLGKPVLVLRDTTERPEAIEAGTVRLVGSETERIITEVDQLITNAKNYDKMSKSHNPYGDGLASTRIIEVLGR